MEIKRGTQIILTDAQQKAVEVSIQRIGRLLNLIEKINDRIEDCHLQFWKFLYEEYPEVRGWHASLKDGKTVVIHYKQEE